VEKAADRITARSVVNISRILVRSNLTASTNIIPHPSRTLENEEEEEGGGGKWRERKDFLWLADGVMSGDS
jgi:hypothetical protein